MPYVLYAFHRLLYVIIKFVIRRDNREAPTCPPDQLSS